MADIQIARQVEPEVERLLDGTVAILTMRYPPYNLLDPPLSKVIADGLRWAAAEGARAVVLRSALRHFSAGADLDAMLAASESGAGTIDWPMLEVRERAGVLRDGAIHGVPKRLIDLLADDGLAPVKDPVEIVLHAL